MNEPMFQTMTAKEIADVLKTSPRNAAQWCHRHRVASMKVGPAWRFDKRSFETAYRRAVSD